MPSPQSANHRDAAIRVIREYRPDEQRMTAALVLLLERAGQREHAAMVAAPTGDRPVEEMNITKEAERT